MKGVATQGGPGPDEPLWTIFQLEHADLERAMERSLRMDGLIPYGYGTFELTLDSETGLHKGRWEGEAD